MKIPNEAERRRIQAEDESTRQAVNKAVVDMVSAAGWNAHASPTIMIERGRNLVHVVVTMTLPLDKAPQGDVFL